MGLQFIDLNGNERTLTEADMLLPDFREAYSDLFKGLNGFRPRGEYFYQPDVMLSFFDTYEEEFDRQAQLEAQDNARRLAYLSEKHGQSFESLFDAERFNEKAAFRRYIDQLAAEEKARAEAAEMARRYSPSPLVEDWLHGQYKGHYA